MITAQEARKLADGKAKKKKGNILFNLYQGIMESAQQGNLYDEFYIGVDYEDQKIYESLIHILKGQGFTADTGIRIGYISISWEEE